MRITALIVALFLLIAGDVRGQVVRFVPDGSATVIARPGSIELWSAGEKQSLWIIGGPLHPRQTAVAAGGNRAAVIDPIDNVIELVDLESRSSRTIRLHDSPHDAVFLDDDLFYISRGRGAISRIDRNGNRSEMTLGGDLAHLRSAGGGLLVAYERMEGVLHEIDANRLRLSRSVTVSPYASDLAVAEREAWLVHPRSGRITTVNLESFSVSGERNVGAVPIAVTPHGDPTLLTAGEVVIADPASKRIWREERGQPARAAFGRGFMRGLLGLGLYRPSSSEFPTGIDRVASAGPHLVAFDTASGTLYSIPRRGQANVLAHDLASTGWDLHPSGLIAWMKSSDEAPVIVKH